MANTVILGRVRPINTGEWSSTRTYEAMERVEYNTVLWEAQKAVPINTVPEKGSEYWYPISALDVEEVDTNQFVNLESDQVINGKKDFAGEVLAKTPGEGDDSRRVATTKYVVTALKGKADDDKVVKLEGDQTIEGTKDFHGDLLAQTKENTDNSNHVATTAYVQNVLGDLSDIDGEQLVNIAGDQTITGTKTFTGDLLVPTAEPTDNSQKAANTAFVRSLIEQSGGVGGSKDAVTLTGAQTITGDKTFEGEVLVKTQITGDSTQKAASTAFVQDALTHETEAFRQQVENAVTAAETASTAAEGAVEAVNGLDSTVQGIESTLGSVQEAIEEKVSKNGDTMTGPLEINLDSKGSAITSELPDNSKWLLKNMDTDALEIPDIVHAISVNFWDKNNKQLGYFQHYQDTQGDSNCRIMAHNYNAAGSLLAGSELRAVVQKDGAGYAICPPPRETVNENDIDTRAASVARHPQKSDTGIVLYVDPQNSIASDTADLEAGRGFSREKPFASILAAVAYATNHFTIGRGAIVIKLCSDCAINGLSVINVNCPMLFIQSPDYVEGAFASESSPSITITNPMLITYGNLAIKDVNLVSGANLNYFLQAQFFGSLLVDGTRLSGTARLAAVRSVTGGKVIIQKITGSVTGKRYVCENGSKILTGGAGANVIPGTEAGTCDASSVYA